jgi:hypothetical protein
MTILWFTLLFAVVSMLHTSVGQAGGSAYLAGVALLGVSPAAMKPTTLVLNVLSKSAIVGYMRQLTDQTVCGKFAWFTDGFADRRWRPPGWDFSLPNRG